MVEEWGGARIQRRRDGHDTQARCAEFNPLSQPGESSGITFSSHSCERGRPKGRAAVVDLACPPSATGRTGPSRLVRGEGRGVST